MSLEEKKQTACHCTCAALDTALLPHLRYLGRPAGSSAHSLNAGVFVPDNGDHDLVCAGRYANVSGPGPSLRGTPLWEADVPETSLRWGDWRHPPRVVEAG